MILKIRSMREGENWHYVDRIARLTISNQRGEALSKFKKRVFTIHDVVLIAPPTDMEPVAAGQVVDTDPRSPHYIGPHLSGEEFEAKCEDFGPPPLGMSQAEWVQMKLAEGRKLRSNEDLVRPKLGDEEGTSYDQNLQYYEAQCVDNDGKEFSVYFDGDAYLLNDQGKTVDHFEVRQQ